jgi:hypothetical protein
LEVTLFCFLNAFGKALQNSFKESKQLFGQGKCQSKYFDAQIALKLSLRSKSTPAVSIYPAFIEHSYFNLFSLGFSGGNP